MPNTRFVPNAQPISPLHAAARYYAGTLGWRIFPIAPGRKDPPLTGKGGFYKASSDIRQIDLWWGQRPDANIGLFCEGSGLHVLDVDTKFEKDGIDVMGYLNHLRRTLGELPYCPVSRTRSGGFHALFDARGVPPDWSPTSDPLYLRAWMLVGPDGVKHKALELKAFGYIVLPPSFIAPGAEADGISGPYVWEQAPNGPAPCLPPSWYQSLRREEPVRPRIVKPMGPCPAKLQGLIDLVLGKSAGDRNNALFYAANRAVEEARAGAYSHTEAYARLYAAGRQIGQHHDECRNALRDLWRAMQGRG